MKREDFPLLSEWSRPTDDSIMTLAVAKALMNSREENDEEKLYCLFERSPGRIKLISNIRFTK